MLFKKSMVLYICLKFLHHLFLDALNLQICKLTKLTKLAPMAPCGRFWSTFRTTTLRVWIWRLWARPRSLRLSSRLSLVGFKGTQGHSRATKQKFLKEYKNWLVVSNMTFIFHFIYGIILPIDELIFFKMLKATNQIKYDLYNGYFIGYRSNMIADWWFGTFFIFPYIGNNNPNWRTHIFQKGWHHQLEYHCIPLIHDCINYIPWY